MGFYFELEPAGDHSFQELKAPTVFWGLYGLFSFALFCMVGASYSVLGTIYRNGDGIDLAMILIFYCVLFGFVLIGVRLVGIRKYIEFGEGLTFGYKIFDRPLTTKRIQKSEILGVEIIHSSPPSNMAPTIHGDTQYFVQGHFQLVVKTKLGKQIILDRSTDNEALVPLQSQLGLWRVTSS